MKRPRNVTTWRRAGRRTAGRGNTTAKWANVTGTSAAVAHSTRTIPRTTTGSERLRRIPTRTAQTASVVANAANQRLTERPGFRSQTARARVNSISATRKRPAIGVMAGPDGRRGVVVVGRFPSASVVLEAAQDDRRVRGADGARRDQDAVHPGGPAAPRHVVEVALRRRNVVVHGR